MNPKPNALLSAALAVPAESTQPAETVLNLDDDTPLVTPQAQACLINDPGCEACQ